MDWTKKINFLLSYFYVALIFVVIGFSFAKKLAPDSYDGSYYLTNKNPIVYLLLVYPINTFFLIGILFIAFIMHRKLQKIPSNLQNGNLTTEIIAISILALPAAAFSGCTLPDSINFLMGACNYWVLIIPFATLGLTLWSFSLFSSSNLLWFKLPRGKFIFAMAIFLLFLFQFFGGWFWFL